MPPTSERKYRLHDREAAAEGVRRVARGQVDLATEALEDGSAQNRDEAVHEARKALKRLRALVRVARDELGDDVYRRENVAFRDAGRKLAGSRDAAVVIQTLDGLAEPGAFGGLREAFTREAAQNGSPRDDEAIADIRAARARIAGWPLSPDAGHDALAPGLERVYRRGRRALRAARAEPTDENFHELRKRAKDLWHAAQVLRPGDPKRLRKLSKRAHALSDAAGDDHDLAVLVAAAHEHADALAPGELWLLERRVADRRADLQRTALAVGSRVYARKPRKLARRVATA